MEPPHYHDRLGQQIRDNLAPPSTNLESQLPALLQAVSQSYASYDQAVHELEAKVSLRTEQLLASTSQSYSFLDTIHKGFMMCDNRGEVVLTNNSLRRILAVKAGEGFDPGTASLTIDLVDKLFQPELSFKDLVNDCLTTSKPLERNDVAFGKSDLKLYLAPLLNEANGSSSQLLGLVVLVEDITEQKLLDRSKDEFLSIASHELRTPLTAIRGNASLIKKHYGPSLNNPDMAEMIDDIHEAAIRLIGIVNDFLDVAAIEQGKISMKPEAFALGSVVEDVIRELESLTAAKGLSLSNDATVAQTPTVLADKQRIKQVLINLVGNAVKFTDEGGITISASADEHFVSVVVRDSGKGMSEANQKLLFRKFQQAGSSLLTRDTTKGTGLGLYISKLIVELSGGRIGLVSSEPGVGSAFAFTLPRA